MWSRMTQDESIGMRKDVTIDKLKKVEPMEQEGTIKMKDDESIGIEEDGSIENSCILLHKIKSNIYGFIKRKRAILSLEKMRQSLMISIRTWHDISLAQKQR